MAAPPARTEISDTYPNPSNATARTGLGKLWDYATGLLGSTGNAAEARTALGIGPVISFRNRVRNGAFNVNQRNVSPASVILAAGAAGHDGWKAGASGCTYSFSTTGITTTLTISAGSLVQVIEGTLIEGGIYCMSWTGTAQGKIGGGSFSASGVNSSSQTAGSNLTIEFGTGTLANVQVELGTSPTPFERRPYSFELNLCQRYLYVISGATTFGAGQATASNIVTLPVVFPQPMRVTPSLLANNITAITATATPIVANVAAASVSSPSGMTINFTMASSSFVAGNASIVVANLSSAFLLFSAEL